MFNPHSTKTSVSRCQNKQSSAWLYVQGYDDDECLWPSIDGKSTVAKWRYLLQIVRCRIMVFTGHPKGFMYRELQTEARWLCNEGLYLLSGIILHIGLTSSRANSLNKSHIFGRYTRRGDSILTNNPHLYNGWKKGEEWGKRSQINTFICREIVVNLQKLMGWWKCKVNNSIQWNLLLHVGKEERVDGEREHYQ